MQRVNRITWKLAERVQAQLVELRLQRYREFENQLAYLTTTLSQLGTTRRKLSTSISRRFTGASQRLRSRTINLIADLPYQIQTAQRLANTPIPGVPRLADIVSEMDQVAEEFGDWHYDAHDDAICVRTDAIDLEGLYLGPFEIRLIIAAMSELRSPPPFIAAALDPHPASGADHITHPHVSDDRVCLGEAGASVASALESGRIGDFFLIVRSVLTNYNPDSPYVSIDDWMGEQCSDCGGGIGEDDRYFCEVCDQTYCESCSGMCRNCDLPACLGCLRQCSFCDEWSCRECVKTCTTCAEACCKGCMQEELCPDCHERNESDADSTQNQEEQEPHQASNPVTSTQPEAA